MILNNLIYPDDYINKVINGDCLDIMKNISDKSIDLIYCDILYGTGKIFKDYIDLKTNYNEVKEFYTPKIIEMKRILKEIGSIYLHMDYRISHWMRFICDEILEFECEIIWAFESPSGYESIGNKFVRGHDKILIYVKDLKKRIHNKQYIPYKFGYKNIKGKGISVSTVWKDIQTMKSMINKSDCTGYSSQKPKLLLKRIIKASSDENDIVADFFCGSGTTGVVAKELNRKYILCDINKRACEISEERISKVRLNNPINNNLFV